MDCKLHPQTDGFPESIIVSSSTNTTPHLLKLKATQQGGAETRISGFSVDMTGAVNAQANPQLLVLVTDSSLRVIEAKVRTASNQVIDLVPVASSQQATGAFSLASLPGGVYTLDVITQKGSAKAAYEGVLSIGNQPLTVIEETTKRVTNEYGDLILIFLSSEECPKGYALDNNGRCKPICDVTEPPDGGECIDVGDPEDCEPGFVDRGNGCEPEEGSERPVCTPNGPPCPPCPEGVEAGWCADEDERQDTDETDEEEENTQNCGGEPCTDTEKEDSWLDDEEVVEEETEETNDDDVEEEEVSEEGESESPG
jgi:hypothetical protein